MRLRELGAHTRRVVGGACVARICGVARDRVSRGALLELVHERREACERGSQLLQRAVRCVELGGRHEGP